MKRRKYTIIIEGETDSDIALALDEILVSIEQGFLYGSYSNNTSNYHFESKEIEAQIETH